MGSGRLLAERCRFHVACEKDYAKRAASLCCGALTRKLSGGSRGAARRFVPLANGCRDGFAVVTGRRGGCKRIDGGTRSSSAHRGISSASSLLRGSGG